MLVEVLINYNGENKMKINYEELKKLEQEAYIITPSLPDLESEIRFSKSFDMLLLMIDMYFRTEKSILNDGRKQIIENTLKDLKILTD